MSRRSINFFAQSARPPGQIEAVPREDLVGVVGQGSLDQEEALRESAQTHEAIIQINASREPA